MNKTVIEKVESMILWGMLWDSLGIPVEMQTKDQIRKILLEHQIKWDKVSKFLPPTLHKLYREWDYDQNAEIISSDDTYCTRAAMNSLVEKKDIDLYDMMIKNIDFYKEFSFWYGGTTKKAYGLFESGEDITKTGSPGWWNGVLMKLSPLSTYMTLRWYDEKVTHKILSDFSKMTHTHESVVNGTIIHHMFLEHLLSSQINTKELLHKMLIFCKANESKQNTIPLSPILEKIISLEESGKIYQLTDNQILEYFWWWDKEITKFSWRVDITIGMCYALFLRNPNLGWIIDAVSIWWDTDTYGAIVWNMVWASAWDKISEDYISQIPEIESIKQETHMFIGLLETL